MAIRKITSFPGQFSWEKILYAARQHPLSFLLSEKWHILSVIVVAGIVFILGWFLDFRILSTIVSILILVSYIVNVWVKYWLSVFIVTSKRIINKERSGLFESHLKDLRLENVKQCVSSKESIIQMIFKFWWLTVHSFDDIIHLHFEWLPYHGELARYISRIVDHIRTNGATDEITIFHQRKLRKKLGKVTKESAHKYDEHGGI